MSKPSPQAALGSVRLANWQHVKIARDFTYSALWMAYGAMLMVVGFWRRSAFVRWQALVLIAFTIGKVFLYDVSELDRGYRIVSFIVLGALLLAISFVYQRDWLRLSEPEGILKKGSAGSMNRQPRICCGYWRRACRAVDRCAGGPRSCNFLFHQCPRHPHRSAGRAELLRGG